MGVPAFFRWLTVRYPQVVIDALTEQDLEYYYAEYDKKKALQSFQNQHEMELDPQILIQRKVEENNPKVDNLYLDMNGIIHPCCHPLDRPQPTTEMEMFGLIFEYMDRVIGIVKPSKILYLAVDGVAPRAKMNQQRSRRFRTALDAQEKADRTASIKSKWAAEGIKFTDRPTEGGGQTFDSNVITPGTEFMANLSKALQLCIVERLHNSEQWQHLQVIFSDASVPGEGEHKILDFIRSQRAQKNYDPNTSHCIHGADADLIMLGLSTHEPHFYILREAVLQEKDKKCRRCGQSGHLAHECGTEAANDPSKVKLAQSVQFQFVKLAVVREYLYLEFKDLKLPYTFDFEQIVDDFVFLCFFVGNDFLPHLPSLSIREGALDALLFMYKNALPRLGGYLTKGAGELDFTKVDILLSDVARVEEDFFKQHQQNAQRNEEHRKRDDEKQRTEHERQQQAKIKAQADSGHNQEPVKWKNEDKRGDTKNRRDSKSDRKLVDTDNNAAATSEPETKAASQVGTVDAAAGTEELTDYEKNQMTAAQFEQYGKAYVFANIMCKPELTEQEKMELAAQKLQGIVKKQMQELADKKVEAYEDKVQLGKQGWKERYYAEKFEVRGEEETKTFRRNIRKAYIEGLAWVFAYYYKGCTSWHWYYPYHYAPFASDLLGCDSLTLKFELGEPAKPFEQLLAVFPKQSNHAIPACYRQLYEPGSDVLDFYPSQVKLDINGARYAWMGVNLLSFIDRARLQRTMAKADQGGSLLSARERERNRVTGDVRLFFLESPRNADAVLQKQLLEQEDEAASSEAGKAQHEGGNWPAFQASFAHNDGIAGEVGPLTISPDASKQVKDQELLHGQAIDRTCGSLEFSRAACLSFQVRFLNPKYKEHSTKLLKGVVLLPRQVEDFAIYHTNRRIFQGEAAIKIVEAVLQIDASQDPVYQFGGRSNRSGQEYGGYRNNHAVYQGGGGFQALPQMGQRRNYQEYRGGQYGDQRQRGYDNQQQKRPRHSNYDDSQYRGGQGYNQAPQHTQGIDFNLRGGTGAPDQAAGSSSIRQNYERQIATAGHHQQQSSQGPDTQLASLLGRFNEPHRGGRQDGNSVLVQAHLQSEERLASLQPQAYQQHLHRQEQGAYDPTGRGRGHPSGQHHQGHRGGGQRDYDGGQHGYRGGRGQHNYNRSDSRGSGGRGGGRY